MVLVLGGWGLVGFGVVAVLLLLPLAANGDEHEIDCHADPTADACTEEEPEVLSEEHEREKEDEAEVVTVDDSPADDRAEPVDVLGVSETALPDIGVDTRMVLGLALGLLALGGVTLARSSRRRQSDPAAG